MRIEKIRKIKKILEKIKKSEKILITSHMDPDGDSLCSQLALANFLESLKKSYEIINQGDVPSKYLFLDQYKRIKNRKPQKIPLSSPHEFDLVMFIECSNLDRVGWVKELIPKESFLINIDHHQDNAHFGHINHVDLSASAAGEILYDIMKASKFHFDKKTAELIYVAIMTDTGRFRYSSTTPKSLRICADLLDCGVDVSLLNQRIYYSFSEKALRLLRVVLERLELFADDKICFLIITHPMLEEFQVPYQDTDDFVDFSLSLEGSKVGALFLEVKKDTTQVSLRSCDFMDVSQIAKGFGGGGHKNASGFLLKGKIEVVKRNVLDSILRDLEKRPLSLLEKKT